MLEAFLKIHCHLHITILGSQQAFLEGPCKSEEEIGWQFWESQGYPYAW